MCEPLGYLTARKVDPDKFYYTNTFKAWINSIKPTFESTKYDEPRIIIPLIYNNTLVGVQGRSFVMNTLIVLNTLQLCSMKMHQRSMVSTKSTEMIQSILLKDLSTLRSYQIRLLCAEGTDAELVVGVLAILFGFMITNPVIEKSSPEFNVQSTTVQG